MKLTGSSSVILYDAKTGEITDKAENNNLVTNAVSNLLNGGLSKIVSSYYNDAGTHNQLEQLYNLPDIVAKVLYGGVLIFSNTVNEDVEHCIPTTEEIKTFLGCGNQEASISGNKYKGVLNASESVVGSNYVTFVWDFTTEQCNGDIACICLTSNLGGQLGYGFNALSSILDMKSFSWLYSDMYTLNTKSAFSSSSPHNALFKSSFTTSNDHGVLLSDKYYCFVYRDKMYRYDISNIMKSGSPLMTKFDKGISSRNTYELIPVAIYYTQYWMSLNENKCYSYDESKSDTVKMVLYDTNENGGVNTVEVPTTNILTSWKEYFSRSGKISINWINIRRSNSVILDGKIYFLVGQVNNADQVAKPNKLRMYILSLDGVFTYKDLNVSSGDLIRMLFGDLSAGGYDSSLDVRFVKILDALYIESADGTNGYKYYMVDKETGNLSPDPVFGCNDSLSYYGGIISKSSLMPEPWVSSKFCGSNSNFLYSSDILSGYLATINNMDTVLTKTADKTMKIIYTLTMK